MPKHLVAVTFWLREKQYEDDEERTGIIVVMCGLRRRVPAHRSISGVESVVDESTA